MKGCSNTCSRVTPGPWPKRDSPPPSTAVSCACFRIFCRPIARWSLSWRSRTPHRSEWTLFARYASTAEYIVGGVTETGRRRDANRVLLWRALAAMKDAGLRAFDMGGMDDAATPPGIYDFKRAMGAAPYRLEGELEADSGRLVDRLVRHRVRAARARGAG